MAVTLILLLLAFSQPAQSIKCAKDSTKIITCDDSMLCFRHHTENGTQPAGCADCRGVTPQASCKSEKKELCCCAENLCNKLETKSTTSTTVFVSMVAGICVIALVTIGVSIFCLCRYKKKKTNGTKGYTSIEASGSSDRETTDSTRSQRKSVAYKVGDIPQDASMIDHEDNSATQIEPIMEVGEKEKLVDSLSNPQPLPGYDEFLSTPRITKLITYGTTDAITIVEEHLVLPAPTSTEMPKDDVAFCGHVLAELINNGPQQYPFELDILKRILKIGESRFAAEPSLLTIQVPCTIYGDIHGQYSDLHRWLNVNGWPNKRRCLFLGDFVDRGSHGVEVVALMCCLKTVFPQGLFVCRGNHEEETLNKAYSFYDEVHQRFKDPAKGDANVYMHFKRVFMQLPLAAIIGKRILGMHGGISPKLKSLQDIVEIKRPIDDFVVGSLACDLVWSDPDLVRNGSSFRPNYDREPRSGIGQLFSPEAVEAACKRLNIDLIVRGHQAPLHGYARWAGGHLLTLFSAPGYKGENATSINKGACMDVSETGELTIKQIQVSEEFRKKRIADVEHRTIRQNK